MKLSWLVLVRWTTVLAGVGAVVAGREVVPSALPTVTGVTVLTAWVLSNVWLTWTVRTRRAQGSTTVAGTLVCVDVLVLSWLLLMTGGVLNPASIFYLVLIVVAALVLGRTWTWIVTTLSVTGYAALFLAQPDEFQAAQAMHPEIGLHMRGMWLAFAVTALIVAILVTRLAIAVERRDVALGELRDRAARTSRAAGLATLAAGAAHELSTPLATIAVAARELERRTDAHPDQALREDARLIRAEIDRCRHILDAMAGQAGESLGETPRPVSIADVVTEVRARLRGADAQRVNVEAPENIRVVWPLQVVARAVGNLAQNALHASTDVVSVIARATPDGFVRLAVIDTGTGMSPEQLNRAGEPFFTTKPAGVGTGLGLFIARSSVEQLGGTLSLVSAPGRGTTATIVLPSDVLSATPKATDA